MVYGFDQELAEDQPGMGTTFIQSDFVGSPSVMTDANGIVIGRSKNLPFGEGMSAWGSKTVRRYTNHEDDSDSNAIYMQAREYLPAYGKFAQVDPAYDQTKDDPESWNLYNYVTNNPVTHTDPDGRIIDDPVQDKASAAQWAASDDYNQEMIDMFVTQQIDFAYDNATEAQYVVSAESTTSAAGAQAGGDSNDGTKGEESKAPDAGTVQTNDTGGPKLGANPASPSAPGALGSATNPIDMGSATVTVTDTVKKGDPKVWISPTPDGGKDKGQFVDDGHGNRKGQCVSLVKKQTGAPATASWREGEQVMGNTDIPPGTAVVAMKNGHDWTGGGHTGLYLGQDEKGFYMTDQYVTGAGHAVGPSFYPWQSSSPHFQRSGENYYVLETP